MIVALIALMIALGGAATAATQFTGANIKNSSITSADIRNGTIKLNDLARSTQRGMVGPRGLPGAPGAPGAAAGPSRLSYVQGPTSTFPPGAIDTVSAFCPPGTKVTGGGWFASIADVGGSLPDTFGGTRYSAIISNQTTLSVDVFAVAICLG
jgi:hypothetical protein